MKKAVILLLLVSLVFSLNNGQAKTPAMGWASYGSLGCNVDEQKIQDVSDKLVSLQLNSLGYEYVILEDCWQDGRNPSNAQIQPNESKFPNGMKVVADYVHQNNQKFGISSDAGTKTCEGYTGSLGYEYIDAQTYASWGADYLEYTNCNNQGIKTEQLYQSMSQALENTERSLYYTAIINEQEQIQDWQPTYSNSWNNNPDFDGSWEQVQQLISESVDSYKYTDNGAWNYLSKLFIDSDKLTSKQLQTQFAFWALLKSPLILDCDILNLAQNKLTIISNQDIIAVNQDPLGYQGVQLENNDNYQVWGVPQDGESSAIIVWNTSKQRQKIIINFNDINQQFQKYQYPSNLGTQVQVNELILQIDLRVQENQISVTLDSQGISMLKLTPVNNEQIQKIYQ